MLRFRQFVLPVLFLALATTVIAQDENPVVTTVKSKLKDKDKPFGMAVIFQVKPGSEKAFEDAFKPCLVATRAEKGCLAYYLNRDFDDPNTYIVFERFRNIAALETHAKTPHVAELVKKIGTLTEGEPKVKVLGIIGE